MMVFIQLLSIQIIACVNNQTVYVRQYKTMAGLFLALLLLACLFILSRDRDNKHVQEQTELLAPMSLCICHAFPQSECVRNVESQTAGYHYKTIQNVLKQISSLSNWAKEQ